jgi:hypothetical protein
MAIKGLGTNRMLDTHRWHHRRTPHGGSSLTDRKVLDRNLGVGKKAEREKSPRVGSRSIIYQVQS